MKPSTYTYILVTLFTAGILVLAGCAVDRLKLSIDRAEFNKPGTSQVSPVTQ